MKKAKQSIQLTSLYIFSHLFLAIVGSHLLVSCSSETSTAGFSGVIETDDLDVQAPFSRELISLSVDDGSVVNQGDTVAILDTVSSAAALRSAVAGASEAKSRLADLRAGFDVEKIAAADARKQEAMLTLSQAERDLKRAESLHSQKLIDDKSVELARLTLARAKAGESISTEELTRFKRGARIDELSAAEAAAERAEAERILRADQLQKSFLISHHSGVVQLTPFQVGEIVSAGRTVVSIQNPQNLWARIYIPEARIADVSVGQQLSFSVDAFPEKQFTATVSQIASETEFTPRNVQSQAERLNLVFAVKLTIEYSDASVLRAGMPADFFLNSNPDNSNSNESGAGDE